MIQRRKQDYLQKLIEDFFSKLQEYANSQKENDLETAKEIWESCISFFQEEFKTNQDDSAEILIQKIQDGPLLEQYAKMLLQKYQYIDIKESSQLYIALDIVNYLDQYDKTFSWDRNILKQDLLRILDEQTQNS